MDIKQEIALAILKGAGGDVDKDYTSTDAIYRDVESIYRAQDNRQDVESLQVELVDNGTYTYDDRNTQGYKPVEINVNVPVDDYYNSGFENGMEIQKSKLESITITENGNYTKEDGYDEVEVNIDTQSFYDNGYNNGYSEGVDNGIQEQKAKLESITIESNGTYIKEDGYNEVKVALDIPKPKIYNGFRFNNGYGVYNDYKYFKDIDFGLFDWSGVYDTSGFFNNYISYDGGGLVASDFDNFIQNYNGDMLSCSGLFNDSDILELPNFGEMTKNCMNMANLARLCDKLEDASNMQYWNTSNVTNMSNMFYECKLLTSTPSFDTSSVTNMSNMFYGCKLLTTIPQLDTSKVTNMSYMFYFCQALGSIPQLDTSNVTDMSNMFYYCTALKSIPQLDTSKVDNVSGMFYSCNKLESLPLLDFGSVTKMDRFINYLAPPTLLTDLGGFKDLGKQNTVSGTGSGVIDYMSKLTHESLMNIINNLYDRKSNGMSTMTIKLGLTHLGKLSDEEKAIATNKGWNLA